MNHGGFGEEVRREHGGAAGLRSTGDLHDHVVGPQSVGDHNRKSRPVQVDLLGPTYGETEVLRDGRIAAREVKPGDLATTRVLGAEEVPEQHGTTLSSSSEVPIGRSGTRTVISCA